MPCPYCNSDEWEETETILSTNVINHGWVEVAFLSRCLNCDKYFKTTEEYESAGDYAYTCEELTDEEIKTYGEGE